MCKNVWSLSKESNERTPPHTPKTESEHEKPHGGGKKRSVRWMKHLGTEGRSFVEKCCALVWGMSYLACLWDKEVCGYVHLGVTGNV